MGANAVANVMAQKYGTEKSQILDAVSNFYYNMIFNKHQHKKLLLS